MKEVFVISQSTHPNIVRYYSCWLERATIDDAGPLPLPQQDPSLKANHSLMCVSSNSGFTFEKTSKKSKANSIRKSQEESKQAQIVPLGKA